MIRTNPPLGSIVAPKACSREFFNSLGHVWTLAMHFGMSTLGRCSQLVGATLYLKGVDYQKAEDHVYRRTTS